MLTAQSQEHIPFCPCLALMCMISAEQEGKLRCDPVQFPASKTEDIARAWGIKNTTGHLVLTPSSTLDQVCIKLSTNLDYQQSMQ